MSRKRDNLRHELRNELLDFVLPVPQQTPVSRKEQIFLNKTLDKRAKANKMLQDLINHIQENPNE